MSCHVVPKFHSSLGKYDRPSSHGPPRKECDTAISTHNRKTKREIKIIPQKFLNFAWQGQINSNVSLVALHFLKKATINHPVCDPIIYFFFFNVIGFLFKGPKSTKARRIPLKSILCPIAFHGYSRTEMLWFKYIFKPLF